MPNLEIKVKTIWRKIKTWFSKGKYKFMYKFKMLWNQYITKQNFQSFHCYLF